MPLSYLDHFRLCLQNHTAMAQAWDWVKLQAALKAETVQRKPPDTESNASAFNCGSFTLRGGFSEK